MIINIWESVQEKKMVATFSWKNVENENICWEKLEKSGNIYCLKMVNEKNGWNSNDWRNEKGKKFKIQIIFIYNTLREVIVYSFTTTEYQKKLF